MNRRAILMFDALPTCRDDARGLYDPWIGNREEETLVDADGLVSALEMICVLQPVSAVEGQIMIMVTMHFA